MSKLEVRTLHRRWDISTLRNVGKVSSFQTTITTLSGFVDHYTSVTIVTDIVAILLKCVAGSYDC